MHKVLEPKAALNKAFRKVKPNRTVTVNTSPKEAEIDRLVYELNELTEEEIRVGE